jgi:hypothetical protein
LFVEINPGHMPTLGAPVVFFPVAHPFIRDFRGELGLCELVESGLVVLES